MRMKAGGAIAGTERINFEAIQSENSKRATLYPLPAWQVKREAEAFRDLIRAVAFEVSGKMPEKILFSWEVV